MIENLNGITVMVTGAGGFIGSHTVELLKLNHAKVIAIDNFEMGNQNKKFLKTILDKNDVFLNQDIKAINQYKEYFLETDYIIHLGAKISVPESMEHPLYYFKTNVGTTEKILDQANSMGVEKIIIASSCTAKDPKSFYGLTKKFCEDLALWYHKNKNIDAVSLRYYNVYGPRQLNNKAVIPAFIKAMLNNEKVKLEGGGEQTRNFVYVKDVARANIKAILSDAYGYCTISGRNNYSIVKLFRLLKKLISYNKKPKLTKAREGDLKEVKIDSIQTFKTKINLDWKPNNNLLNGLKKTIKYYKNE